jgi:ankyrin repeat protein
MDYKYTMPYISRTPLSRAAEKGDERIVKLLLEKGALPDFEDQYSWRPLSRAVEGGSIAVVKLLLAKEVKVDYKYTLIYPYIRVSLLSLRSMNFLLNSELDSIVASRRKRR